MNRPGRASVTALARGAAVAFVVLLAGGAALADGPPAPPPAACLPPRADSCGGPVVSKKDAHAVRTPPRLLPPVLTVVNVHTREALPLDAAPSSDAATRENEASVVTRLLRDRTNWEMRPVAIECVSTIRAACSALTASRVEVVSGYRSDKLNEMLRKKGHHVAQHSQHVLGHAIDFRLPAVPYRDLYGFVRRSHSGGVGAYPESRFVHIDVGPARRWNGE